MVDRARWMDLLRLERGVTVVFEEPWYVPIKNWIPISTRAVVTSQELFKRGPFIEGYIGATPITPLPGIDLCEWGGEIRVMTGLLGITIEANSLSPLGIA